jgi:hypothetical protein
MEQFWFELDWFECSTCDGKAVRSSPGSFWAECPICGEQFEMDFGEYGIGIHRCWGGEEKENWEVGDTPSYYRAVVKDCFEVQADEKVTRRPDYWEVVTHYTSPGSFIAALNDGRLTGAPTGFYGSRTRSRDLKLKSTAVCLSETPIEFNDELVETFGPFGFAFEKSKVLKMGGGPAINLPKKLIDAHRLSANFPTNIARGWSDGLLPFVNKIDDDFNYLHEREWRIPGDVNLNDARPWLVLPEDFAKQLYALGVTPKTLARWLMKYGRIRHEDKAVPLR